MTARSSEDRENSGTRQRMLDVAEVHFARRGYSGAHLEGIASEVGVRKTALYYYFESKSALYTAVLDRIALELDRVVAGALEREELGHVDRLELLADDLNRLLASNLPTARRQAARGGGRRGPAVTSRRGCAPTRFGVAVLTRARHCALGHSK